MESLFNKVTELQGIFENSFFIEHLKFFFSVFLFLSFLSFFQLFSLSNFCASDNQAVSLTLC